MRAKHFIWIFLVLLSAGFLLSFSSNASMDEGEEEHPDVDYTISCMECHADETPDETAAWKSSAHGKMNFGCYICHGDGVENFSAEPGVDGCITCHSSNEGCFKPDKADRCFECHDAHSLQTEKKEK